MRLTAADVGCWLLKSTRPPAAIDAAWRPGTTRTLTRCLRPSYRLALIGVGAPCLLWVSGRERPGVHALGVVAAPVTDDADGAVVPVRLTRLPEPVPRSELLGDPRLQGAEVLRVPAGSNPSWLSPEQFTAVLDRTPPLGPGPGLGRWGA